MLTGWRGVVFASLVAALFLFAINAQPNHEADVAAQDQSVGISAPVTPDERIADYSLGLDVLTGMLVVVAGLQIWLLMRAESTATAAANAARLSAEAATQSVEVAVDTAKKQLRAYVYVASAQVYNLNKADNRYIVVASQNFGQTPAFNKRFLCGEHVREWPLRTVLSDPDQGQWRGVETVGPGRQSIMHIPIGELTEWSERALRNWEHAVYFWGTITYEDVFGEQHFTNVRLVCEGEGLASGRMHATEEGNESS